MVLLGAGAVVAGVSGEWAFSRTGASLPTLLSDLAAGWAFVLAGMVAFWRQPANRSGPLMIAEGCSWFVTNLQGLSAPLAYGAGVSLGGLNEAILAHLILALPSGRLTSRLDRAAVAAAYAVALGLGLLYSLSGGPPYDPYECHPCSAGIPIGPDAVTLLGRTERVCEVLAVLLALLVVALVVRRWRHSTGPSRRVLAPVWLFLGVSLLLLAEHVANAFPGNWEPVLSPFVVIENAGQLAVPFGFLVVALRMRLVRAAVGELMLESSPSPAGLREALLRALGDPSLEIAFWRDGSYRPQLANGDRAIIRIEHEGRPLALVAHDPALAGDARLMETVAAAARLIAERERLQAELRTQLEVADAERRRVERDLHDGAQQRFVSLSLMLASALQQAGPEVQPALALAADELRLGLAELRELARGLHPAILTERGLAAAIESLAVRMPMPIDARIDPGRCEPVVEATAYFVICEALTNVARHARALRASVRADRREGRLVVEIADDGIGGADPDGGGLAGLHDRVSAAGGALCVESPVGGGTRVRAELPCA